jgi:hypothetical protein
MAERNQKWRRNFVIMSLGVAADLLDRVDAAVSLQQQNTRHLPLNRSGWVRRAIERDLAHAERSRRSRRKSTD